VLPWPTELLGFAPRWPEPGPGYCAYRDQVGAFVAQLPTDTVVFSHFIAINAVIGVATNDDRLVIASLDNCSQTVVEIGADQSFRLISMGQQADTLIR
jgi:broad specificity phosphatase PhoE